jgi:acetyl-CoA carboxylase carboxyl transferase beta subunit
MARSRAIPPPEPVRCAACGVETPADVLRQALWLCPACGWHLQMPARDRIASLVDYRTFREFDRTLISVDPLRFADQRAYRARLIEARRRTGLREAVVVGQAKVGGLPVVVAVFDFEFLGGTMGSVVGEKIADAFEVATRRRLPVITVTSSGGARMQEGMLSLVQMAKTASARARHHAAGLAHISVLAHPTFGGVTASFASLGDVLIAEPGAQIGFVGPRVIEATLGEQLPPDWICCSTAAGCGSHCSIWSGTCGARQARDGPRSGCPPRPAVPARPPRPGMWCRPPGIRSVRPRWRTSSASWRRSSSCTAIGSSVMTPRWSAGSGRSMDGRW